MPILERAVELGVIAALDDRPRMIFVTSKFHRITWPKPLHWDAVSGKSPASDGAVNCLIKPDRH
jgi:hypothetical protein